MAGFRAGKGMHLAELLVTDPLCPGPDPAHRLSSTVLEHKLNSSELPYTFGNVAVT